MQPLVKTPEVSTFREQQSLQLTGLSWMEPVYPRWQPNFVNASSTTLQEKAEAKFFRVIQVFSVAQSWEAHPSRSIGCLRGTISYQEAWSSCVGLLHVAADGWSVHLPPFASSEIHGCICTQQLHSDSLHNLPKSLHLSASHLQVLLLNALTELVGNLTYVKKK